VIAAVASTGNVCEKGKLSMWIGRINTFFIFEIKRQKRRIILCWVLRTRMAEDQNLNVLGVHHQSQGNNDEGIFALM
jgi:hypothetical protein